MPASRKTSRAKEEAPFFHISLHACVRDYVTTQSNQHIIQICESPSIDCHSPHIFRWHYICLLYMRLAYAWLIFMLLRQRSYGSLNCSNSRFMQSLRTLSLFIWNDIRWRWCVCKYYYFHLSCLSPFHILGALFLSRSFFSNCSADSHLIRCRMSDLLTPYLKPLRLNCKGRRVSLCSGDMHEMRR